MKAKGENHKSTNMMKKRGGEEIFSMIKGDMIRSDRLKLYSAQRTEKISVYLVVMYTPSGCVDNSTLNGTG